MLQVTNMRGAFSGVLHPQIYPRLMLTDDFYGTRNGLRDFEPS